VQPNSFRELLALIISIFVFQVLLTFVLVAARKLRRHPPEQYPFPRRPLPPVHDERHRFTLYMTGDELFPAMLEAIEAAQHTIFLESFIWKDDELGQRFKTLLEQKANAGLAVYVIFDAFANLVVSRAFKRFPPGIRTLKYPAFPRPSQIFDFRAYARDHRKLLIVDNAVAFIGGYNIGDLYRTKWRDTHVRVTGPIARNLAEMFASFWNRNRRGRPRLDIDLDLEWQSTVRVQRNDASRLVFPIRSMYLDAIERAERYVYLTNAYFIPDRAILEALVMTARRGVDVRVLVPAESNHVLADWLARHYFEFCLRNGIRIFLYQGGMIHAKTATIDGIWSTVGTANLDRLSLAGNHEINLEIYNADFARSMEEIFRCDLTNARELNLADWIKRPWYIKAAELVLSPLWPML
jgi:cardiolipin synthase